MLNILGHSSSPNSVFAAPRRLWPQVTLRPFVILAVSLLLLLVSFAAQAVTTAEAQKKLSSDLQQAISAASTPNLNWVKDSANGRLVKVLILSYTTTDVDLQDLRKAIVNVGGSVYYKYISINGVSAMLPAARVLQIAMRDDVESISSNRLTARTASFLESVTGASAVRGTGYGPKGADGSGVGIAFLDSGIMSSHRSFVGDRGTSRVKRSIDLQKVGDSLSVGVKDWQAGVDVSTSFYRPGSRTMATYEANINSDSSTFPDPYGHGTLVASIAAGRDVAGGVDSTGIATGADLYDIRVLNANGVGQISDALAGIDWVIYHGNEYNIRVLNISLAADSTESYLTDPLCRAVRNAVAAGITVVVAAGNHGRTVDGREIYGSIGSPGNEPSAITVGSANPHATLTRIDDTVNFFSSRGPTRGGYVDAAGVRHPDNLLKPDLVAPGNRVIGAVSTDDSGSTFSQLAQTNPQLIIQGGVGKGLMNASGTSFAAPVVSGTVALLLQANPGLTPQLIKAILQYTAQPLSGANLLQQGTGLINVVGAMQLAKVLMPDIGDRLDAGTLKLGDSILAPGKALPSPYSVIEGQQVPWSRFVYLGGSHVFSGEALFRKFQGVYDPELRWVRNQVLIATPEYLDPRSHRSPNAHIYGFVEDKASSRSLITAGVVQATALLGNSSALLGTGMFTKSGTLSDWLVKGDGIVLSEGIILSEGVVLSEGIILSEGVVLSEGIVVSEGIILSEGIVVSEGIILTEGGQLQVGASSGPFFGEP